MTAASKEVSFTVEPAALPHIKTIVSRAAKLKATRDKLSTRMDLMATHANGCPMDFARLAAADDFNLIHDVCGIARHIDRSTGELTGHFLPRFARPEISA